MSRAKGLQPGREPKGEGGRASELASRDRTSRWDKRPTRSMAGAANPLSNPALWLCGVLCLSSLQPLHAAQRQEDTLYMWIDAHQARVLIGKLRLCSGQEVGGREKGGILPRTLQTLCDGKGLSSTIGDLGTSQVDSLARHFWSTSQSDQIVTHCGGLSGLILPGH